MKKAMRLLLLIVILSICSACSEDEGDKELPRLEFPDDTTNQGAESTKEGEFTQKKETGGLDLTGVNSVKGVLEYKVHTIDTTDKLEPSDKSSTSSCYEADSGKKIVYVSMDIKDLSPDTLLLEDVMKVSFEVAGKTYDTTCKIEKDGDFKGIASIQTKKTERTYFFTNIPEGEDTSNMKIKVTVNEQTVSAECAKNEAAPDKKTVKVGDVIKKDGESQITIDKVEFTSKFPPSVASDLDTTYEITDPSKLYVVLTVEAKNLGEEVLPADRVMGMQAVYNKTEVYDSFSTAEIEGELRYTNITDIDSGETVKLCYLSEVPKQAKNGNTKMELAYGGENYYLQVN